MKVGDNVRFKNEKNPNLTDKTIIAFLPDGQVVYQAKSGEGAYYVNSAPPLVLELVPPPRVNHKVWVNLIPRRDKRELFHWRGLLGIPNG